MDASDPSSPDFLVICVLSLTGFASFAAAPGNLLGGNPVPPVVVGLFVAATRPCGSLEPTIDEGPFGHRAVVPLLGGKPVSPPTVDLDAQGAAVPAPDAKLVVDADLLAQGAAVPTPGTIPSVDAGFEAHGAFVPSAGTCAVRADAFSSDS